MKISDNKVNMFRENEVLFEFYKIKNPLANYNNELDRYSYYSKSKRHMNYYLAKKIIQILSSKYDLCLNNPRDKYYIEKLDYIIECIKEDNDINFSVYYYGLNYEIKGLFEHNCYINNKVKKSNNIVERVDNRIYGGGYGIKETWKDLFDLLTICERHKIISTNELILFLTSLKEFLCNYGFARFKSFKIMSSNELTNSKDYYNINDMILCDDYYDLIYSKFIELYDKDLLKHNNDLYVHFDKVLPKIMDNIKVNNDIVLKKML